MTDDRRSRTPWIVWLFAGDRGAVRAAVRPARGVARARPRVDGGRGRCGRARRLAGQRWEAGAAGPVSEQNRGVVRMWQSLKRWWKYLGVKLRVVHEERADPKVQLEQAILEARARTPPSVRRRGARRRAAEAGTGSTRHQGRGVRERQGVRRPGAAHDRPRGAARERRQGRDVHDRGRGPRQPGARTRARDSATSTTRCCSRRARRSRRRPRSCRTRPRCRRSSTRRSVCCRCSTGPRCRRRSTTPAVSSSRCSDADVPTFAEVERKIQTRNAVAQAKGELASLQASNQVDPAVLEIEAAQQSAEAQALLVQMRSRLGLADPDGPRMLER